MGQGSSSENRTQLVETRELDLPAGGSGVSGVRRGATLTSGGGQSRGNGGESIGIINKQFPLFQWSSVQGMLIIVQLAVYIISCVLITPRGYVQPTTMANWKLGSSQWFMERCAYEMGGFYLLELRRTVMPIFLHGGLMHIAFNLYFQFAQGSRCEYEFGRKKFLFLFLIAGICGNLMSDAFGVNGVGASTSCYGLIGVQVGRIFLIEWVHLSPEVKTHLQEFWGRTCMFLAFWEVMNWQTIDHYGHLGGLLGGVCCGVLLEKERNMSQYTTAVIKASDNQQLMALLCLMAIIIGGLGSIFLWPIGITSERVQAECIAQSRYYSIGG